MNDINELLIRGFIVNKFVPENTNIVILTISVASKKSNMPNYPKVVFFGNEAKEANKFNLYDNIEVVAEIQTRRKIVDESKTYTQSIVGKSIKETSRTLSAAFSDNLGGAYLHPENSVKIKGTVRQTYLVSDNVLSLTIETFIQQRHSFIKCFIYGKQAKRYIESLTAGTEVVALGEIQTLKKSLNGETAYFENVVIKEIKHLE